MTGVVLGKANGAAMTVAEFKDLLGALIDARYVSLKTLRPAIDGYVKSDLSCAERTAEEDAALEAESGEDDLYGLFQTVVFTSIDQAVSHYQKYPNRSLPFTDDLYDWGTIEGDYGYKLKLPAGHPVRELMELVIDAARERNALLKWENAPIPEVSFMCLCQFGLYINLRPCPPQMGETLLRQPRYAAISGLLSQVFGQAPTIYTLSEQ